MNITTRNLTKRYLLKTALDSLSVTFMAGKIHALVGENGAGKSTLAGMLSGDIQPSEGEILLDGQPVHFSSAKDALKSGIVLVHQRPLLAAGITAKENIILQLQATGAKSFLLPAPSPNMLDLRDIWAPSLNLNAQVKDLGGNLRFYTALIGALLQRPKVLMLDEPSAFLDMEERSHLYAHLRNLADIGTNIIVITHSHAEATNCADTITHLKGGKLEGKSLSPSRHRLETSLTLRCEGVASIPLSPRADRPKTCDSSPEGTGNSPQNMPPRGANAISLTHVSSRPKFRPVLLDTTFSARFGEITAITGLQEAAMDTLEDVLTGMETSSAKGEFTLTDAQGTHTISANHVTPQFLRAHGAAIVPSDRNFRAANPAITVEQLLSVYAKKQPRETALKLIEQAGVAITPEQRVSNLSGGMLQRLILTRELSTAPNLLLLCTPMQGLDIQAQGNICQTLSALAQQGKAIVILGTQDFPMTLCRKVYQMEAGKTSLIFEGVRP